MATKKSISIWVLGTLIVGGLLAFALATGLGTATAQQAAPTETKGVTPTVLATVDLGPEIPGMQGRQLRLRIVTLEPGGVMEVHSHKDRPEVAYVLNGTVTEHRGDMTKEYRAGDSWATGNESHWIENKGTIPATVLSTDIFKQQ